MRNLICFVFCSALAACGGTETDGEEAGSDPLQRLEILQAGELEPALLGDPPPGCYHSSSNGQYDGYVCEKESECSAGCQAGKCRDYTPSFEGGWRCDRDYVLPEHRPES